MTPFKKKLMETLRATKIDILQINLGYICNLTCKHCHVEAGPHRTEIMSQKVMDKCLTTLTEHPISTIDITGGAPEMHPQFSWFLQECAKLNRRLIVRSNGVILLDNQYSNLIDLYTRLKVELVISLPHLDPAHTDRQRGEGVFNKDIQALQTLSQKGYGVPGSGLILDLVHNPGGAYLPGSQPSLEQQYKETLRTKYNIQFNNLFCITNMPLGRYKDFLQRTDNYDDYMQTLITAFNPTAVKNVMCKSTISVAWDGVLYDCDFNQVLGLPITKETHSNIMDFDFQKLSQRQIVIDDHCYGCTAGAGSSCQGEIS